MRCLLFVHFQILGHRQPMVISIIIIIKAPTNNKFTRRLFSFIYNNITLMHFF